MDQVPVTLSGNGRWWIGQPDAWPVTPTPGQSTAAALEAVLAELGIGREDLSFASDDLRQKFEAEFGS